MKEKPNNNVWQGLSLDKKDVICVQCPETLCIRTEDGGRNITKNGKLLTKSDVPIEKCPLRTMWQGLP